MKKPYVVSADIYLLIEKWAIQHAFVLPPKEFFCQLRKEFSTYMLQIFPNFELVSEDEISKGLTALTIDNNLPTVSLDRIYFQSKLNLEITRLVNEKGGDGGLGHRAETPTLLQQIKNLQISGVNEVIIVDDVIFSGELLERILNLLSKIGIRVPLVCAGIGIVEGINRISNAKREVRCVRTYKEVVDEICERDFYPGVPFSGRLLMKSNNVGVPYLLPFGNPEKWASIPCKHSKTFSTFCLRQTISLFNEIERYSNKPVLCQNLGRKVVGLPTGNISYVDALKKILQKANLSK